MFCPDTIQSWGSTNFCLKSIYNLLTFRLFAGCWKYLYQRTFIQHIFKKSCAEWASFRRQTLCTDIPLWIQQRKGAKTVSFPSYLPKIFYDRMCIVLSHWLDILMRFMITTDIADCVWKWSHVKPESGPKGLLSVVTVKLIRGLLTWRYCNEVALSGPCV